MNPWYDLQYGSDEISYEEPTQPAYYGGQTQECPPVVSHTFANGATTINTVEAMNGLLDDPIGRTGFELSDDFTFPSFAIPSDFMA